MNLLTFLSNNAWFVVFFLCISYHTVNAQSEESTRSAQPNINGLRQCTGLRVRKEIRDLTQKERNDYFSAIKTLVDSGIYDTLVTKHATSNGGFWDNAHFTPFFLLMHRILTREVEDLLQDILGTSFALPYWDWSLDSQAPGRSVIFTKDYIGSNDPSDNYAVIDGPFAKGVYSPRLPITHNLVREYDMETMSTFYHPSILANVLAENKTFSEMSQDFEYGAHAIVHTNVGGTTGDMAMRTSLNDPIFWLHHSFVDKLWNDWQSQGDNKDKFDGAAYNTRVSKNTIVPIYNVAAGDVLESKNLCVQYEQPGTNAKSLSVDSKLTQGIKAPESLPDAWFEDMGGNKTVAETVKNETIASVNEANRNITLGIDLAVPPTAANPIVRYLASCSVKQSVSFAAIFAFMFLVL